MLNKKEESKIKGDAARLPESSSDKAATPSKSDLDKAGQSIKSPFLRELFNAKTKKGDSDK